MATRTVKSDSGNDLKLSNNGGTGSVTITDAGDLTIDSPADIVLDAEGADITLKDGGTAFGTLKQASGHLVIQPTSSKEIILNDQAGTASLTVDTANQRVSINNGNIAFSTADKGIDFSGAQTSATDAGTGTTTSEILTSYEEGTWTPANTGFSFAVTHNRYTKIGRIVNVTAVMETASGGTGTAAVFTGLPFTAGGTFVGPVVAEGVNWASGTYMQAYTVSGQAQFYLVTCGDNIATNTAPVFDAQYDYVFINITYTV